MPYNNHKGLIAQAVVMEVITIAAVAVRLRSRKVSKAGLEADDYLLFVAVVFATGLSILQIYGASVGALGVPLDATIEDAAAVNHRLNIAKHCELTGLLLGVLAVGFIKMSVVSLYHRIFARWVIFRWAARTYLALLAIWTVGFLMAIFLECGSHLLALFSTPQAYIQYCKSAIPSGYGLVISDAITDLLTVLLPLPMVPKLKFFAGQKTMLIAVICIGLLSVAASGARAGIYIEATLNLYTSDAITIITSLSVWQLTEVHVGILAACLMTSKPVVKRYLPSVSLTGLITRFSSSRQSAGSPPRSRQPSDQSSGNLSSEENLKNGARTQHYAASESSGRLEAGLWDSGA